MQQKTTHTSTYFRISQIILFLPLLIREWINALTDIARHSETQHTIYKIMSFPTHETAQTLINRSWGSHYFAKIIVIVWILFHILIATLLTLGVISLLFNIKKDNHEYKQKKQLCLFGSALAISFYVMMLGAGAMDFFLSWLQTPALNFTTDLLGYSLPFGIALLYLVHD